MSAAVAAFDTEVSPAGARRERHVPCLRCRALTLNIDALCNEHRPLKPCQVCLRVPTTDGLPCSVCSAFDNGGDRG